MRSLCTVGGHQALEQRPLMLMRRVSFSGRCVRIFWEQVTCINDRRSGIRPSMPLTAVSVVMTYDDTDRPLHD